ncbi:plectin isoform X6 [Cynoglossus semilaevis]|uniref:plectin isoform X6 n=1 Tax=Cynoglossus semilaevis TaxID=244447 RepID=UPI0004974CDC|nr:plectin-like isoform X6 [Cynoglossus semilaevis]
MVAGMLMPLRDLRAIYEVLFRDGVMVAKKDKRPQIKHSEVQVVTNLQVIRAMGSLKSRGLVKETFAWRHYYWYLTNEGIVYLRDYLNLPPEIVPASLQRVRKPAATLAIAQRASRVQTVEGPTSYVPKPRQRCEGESQEAHAERQGYRHKMMGPGERGSSDRTPRFRGRPLDADSFKPKASWEGVDQRRPLFERGNSLKSEATMMEESRMKKGSSLQSDVSSERQLTTSQERRVIENQKKASSSDLVQKPGLKHDVSQTTVTSLSSKASPPGSVPATINAVNAATTKVPFDQLISKRSKEKLNASDDKPIKSEEMSKTMLSTTIIHDTVIGRDKAKESSLKSIKSAEVMTTDSLMPEATVTFSAAQESTGFSNNTITAAPIITEPVSEEVIIEKTSTVLKTADNTVNDKVKPMTAETKESAPKITKFITETVTTKSEFICDKPAKKDVKKEGGQKADKKEGAIKPEELKTTVEMKKDDKKVKKSAQVIVTQETTKPDISMSVITEPVREAIIEKTSKKQQHVVTSTVLKSTVKTISEKTQPMTTDTKESAPKSAKIVTETVATKSEFFCDKPAKKDVNKEVAIKPEELKTKVEIKKDDKKVQKSVQVIVTEEITKPVSDSDISMSVVIEPVSEEVIIEKTSKKQQHIVTSAILKSTVETISDQNLSTTTDTKECGPKITKVVTETVTTEFICDKPAKKDVKKEGGQKADKKGAIKPEELKVEMKKDDKKVKKSAQVIVTQETNKPDISMSVITEPVSEEVIIEKNSKKQEHVVTSAVLKKTDNTISDKVQPTTANSKDSDLKITTVVTETVTKSDIIFDKPVKKDVKKEGGQNVDKKEEALKPEEPKTKVEIKKDDIKVKKSAQVIVTQETTKLDISMSALSTDTAAKSSGAKVVQEASSATQPHMNGSTETKKEAESLKTTTSKPLVLEVTTNVSTNISAPSANLKDVVEKTVEEVITKQDKTEVKFKPRGTKETMSKEVVTDVLLQDSKSAQAESLSQSGTSFEETEAINEAKQVVEGSSKSKRKKKKSLAENSKGVNAEEEINAKVEKKMTSEDKPLNEVTKISVQPVPMVTSEPVPESEKNTFVEDIKEVRKQKDIPHQGEKKPRAVLQQTKETSQSVDQKPAEPPVVIQGESHVKEKVAQSSVTTLCKTSQGPVCTDDASNANSLHMEAMKTENTDIHRVEMVTVQKITQVEILKESFSPEKKVSTLQSETQKAVVETKDGVSTEKAAEEKSKSKKKGKGKKQTKTPDTEIVDTKSVLSPKADEPAPTVSTTLLQVTVKDSGSVTELDVSPKMSPDRICSEEVVQEAAAPSEAPADKREEEPTQLSVEKIKREVPKPKTSSTVREAPAAGESASEETAEAAGAQTQASPLVEQEEPPIVAQHLATQAAECSTEKRLSVSEASTQEESRKRNLEEDTPSAPATPAAAVPDQPHLSDSCDSVCPDIDEATMRKKIVVVEEIIEVKQLVSPQAAGAEPPLPPVQPEEEEEELDLDVLEEIAKERAILQEAAKVKGASPDVGWDHSLEEPEEKTWPNFLEDERDRVQKKTFTKWVNKHLIKHCRVQAQRHVTDLYEDLRDGHNLISLLEVLSGETLPREKGRMRFHKLQNVQIALDFLRHRQVKLVNIRNDDIADGNPKLTLGLIWTIILHFQVSSSISDIQVNGQSEDMTAKEKLLFWSQRMTDGYQGLRCDNFSTSWRDGKLFNAVIHKHYPRLIDMGKVYRQTNVENLEQAFSVAERDLGVTRLLDPEDVDVPHPDEKSIITYVSSLYDVMPRMDTHDGVRTNELELRWQEYYELVTILLQWIRHHVMIFEERKFPASYEEIELLWRQFLKFKETELPVKESEKNHSKHVYQSFESAVHAGQVKVPPGYHPIDVEKEWGRLHVAILERERLLRTEFERLERLQRIVSKVQMESGLCNDQLSHLETLLQTDIRLLSSGKPAQHTAEVERELDKADKMIRLLFNDVQILKDGRHPQAEDMYRKVFRIHERLVNLRSDYNLRLKSAVVPSQANLSSIQQSTTRVRPEMDDVTLRYVQDLLAWVEENQLRIDEAQWGSDLPSVESQLGSHRGLHQTVEDFRSKIERAKADETQISPVSRGNYKEYLGKLDLQYGKLLNSSKFRLRNLESIHAFVSAATKELMWLNDKEEEEVNFDWSDRNSNMTAKKDNYSGLMRELELREKKINDIQTLGDRLVRDGHPGKKTVEAFTAALQTQWSWILQLCCCIEAHLKENTAYYQFFADVKDAQDKMKKMQENMKKKYSCDRSTTATRLEDLLQDAAEEREQLNEFKTMVTGLNKRAKSIVQLKPRNPTTSIKGKLPVQAVCDFKQQEITVHKADECALLNNSQPFKWKVLNHSGHEAVVPSVCFIVPPVNKEAMDSVSSLDAAHQQMVSMWQLLHIDMKSLLSWQYLMRDFTQIHSWNITMLKTMKPEEYRLLMRNLELHYQDFMRDSQDSQLFGADDRMQVEGDYNKSTQHFNNLLRSMEKGQMVVNLKGQQDETLCKNYISEIKDLRLQIENCEARTVERIRRPIEKEPLKECVQKTTEQKKVQVELEGLKKDLDKVTVRTEGVLSSAQQPASAPVLRSELDLTVQKMDHAHMLSSIYLEKLKTVEMVIRNTQGAEGVLKQYEDCLREVHTVPSDVKEVENYRAKLKKMRVEAENEQPVFDSMEEELRKASAVSNKMSRVHSERDVELDHYRQLLSGLQDRWKAVFTQIDLRQRELDQLGRQLGYYRESYDWLIQWISEAKKRQEKIQAVPITDSKTLKEQLAQEKKLLEEIEKNKDRVDECQKYAKAYIDTIKDYELQLVAYKAQVEPLAAPMKKTKLDSASDNIIQEYVTLRTKYSELMTLTSQYIKFITDTQRRLEDEEIADAQQKQIEHEKTMMQQTFLTEKEMLLKKEKLIEDEKRKLESQFEEEVKKARALKEEQERQRQLMEEEKKKLQATMDAALNKQKAAETEMYNKQKEMQELENKRLEQERILAEENQKLREKLQQLEEAAKDQHTKEIVTIVETTKTIYNGQSAGDVTDSVEKKPDPLSFDGIRDKVPASRLYDIGFLPKKDFDNLKNGKATVEDLGKRDNLKRVLKGNPCIAGVLTPSAQKLSIYQASKEKKITPGTAQILLEAQAATGYMLDPIKSQKLTVNEAVKENLIGPELHNKMLLAERAVVGYKDPYTGGKISVFEAMKKGLIEHDHAIRVLEAQLATGGIIDPINSHRVPNDIAYTQGLYDEEMNKILEKPSDDTKGYFDPSTQEPLTYSELMARCTPDPDTGFLLLPITDKAAQCSSMYTEEETKDVFNKTTVSVPFGRFKGKTVTIWEIINSEYFTDDQKKDLLRQYKTGKITIEKIIRIVITVAEDKEKKNEILFDGLRAPVAAAELVESKTINKDLYNQLQKGKATVKDVSEMEHVHKALKGTNPIAGVIIDSSKKTMSFYEAMKKDMMRPGPALIMLEAQAGTGYIFDPVLNQKYTVDEAVKAGVVGPELHEKLLSAERAVTGFKDPYTGKTISLFEAMKKGLILEEQGIRLLDAQMSTGGIIDPVKSYHVSHDVACKRNFFDDEMKQSLDNPTNKTKCFLDPNKKENVTYAQLFKRCVTDKKTGLQLLPLSDEAINAKDEPAFTEAQAQEAMTQATLEIDSGPFKGRKVTIWEILNSEYLTEQQRLDLLKQFRSGRITIEKLIKIMITIVEEIEIKKQEKSSFKGLRAPVSASSLLDSKIIDRPTFELLQQGKITPNKVSENPSVHKYLQGSESIAGIHLEPTKEKMSIYQAMKKKLLRHNTGLALLEAQAATGFMVDPVRNQFLSVDEAVKSGLIGPEVHEKLLSAEKAVTGYKDPFTGNKISLYEAMQKDLILKEHALPMLEAQMVSGGIIDPVNSHRVPADAAYEKKIFSRDISKTLSEPSDENKAYSDPESNENVTYSQLKDRCQRDPETGLYILSLSKPQSPTVVEKTYLYTEEQTQSDLVNTQIDIPIEGLADKPLNLWDVMNSTLLPDAERQKLMDEYRSGKITKERMIIIIIEIMEQREIIRNESPMSYMTLRRRITIEELYNARIIDLETYNLLKHGKRNIRDVMELSSVKQYLYGTGCVAGVTTDASSKLSIYQAMKRGFLTPEIAMNLLETQAATGFLVDPVKNETLTVDEAVRKGVVGPEIHDKLLSAERAVTGYKDPYSGKIISLFQAMKKDLVPEDYALKILEAQNATGGIIDPEFQFHLPSDVAIQKGYMNKETNEKLAEDVKGFVDPVTEEKLSYAELLKRCKLDGGLRLLSLGDKRLTFKGLRKQITMEELISSQIIDQQTVTELNEGLITVEEVSKRLSKYLEGTSSIAGVFLESTKERLSIYQAMKKNMIRPGTAFELLEAQAATGYVIDPIKNLKLTVNEAVKMGIVGPEFKDKLLSAERAVTGYRDPYSGKTISLFQAMKKGLILKDHGIRLLEAQIATGGIIDPEESHRLPVEVAYKRGFFDEEMNEILTDPSDDTKGFFDPNTEENLTYLGLMDRCIMDPDTGLMLLLLKDKKRERKTSSKSSVRKRRVVIVDPETGKEMTVYEAYRKGLIDHQTYLELAEQECEWEEITMTSSDGTVKSMIIDRRSGRQYDVDEAISRGLIDQKALDSYRTGNLSITEFADMLSGNTGGFRSRSSSFGSTTGSSFSSSMSPIPSIKAPAVIWNDPSEVTVPIAGMLDIDTLEKVSVTEAIHRNLLDNITGQRLLEAQACTGGIIDPTTGERLSVADATERGLVDKIMVDRLTLAQKAFNGFEDPRTKVKMSASQALKKGWLYYEAGQRFLEVQYLTGGLIEPDVEGRVSIDESIKKGTIDARTAQKLRDVHAYSKYLTCPKTKLKISFKDAMDKSMVEEGTGLRLLEASSQSTKGLYSPYNASGPGSAYGSRSGSRTGSRTGSRRGSIDAGSSFMTLSSSSFSSSSTSYGRRF